MPIEISHGLLPLIFRWFIAFNFQIILFIRFIRYASIAVSVLSGTRPLDVRSTSVLSGTYPFHVRSVSVVCPFGIRYMFVSTPTDSQQIQILSTDNFFLSVRRPFELSGKV